MEIAPWVIGPFLVFVRVMALLTAVPFFGHGTVPYSIVLLLGLGLTVGIAAPYVTPLPLNKPLWAAVAGEVLAGASMGFLLGFVLYIARMGGLLIGQEMGFAMASIADPLTGASVPLLGHLFELLMIAVFFTLDGHHAIIRLLEVSFHTLPPGGDYSAVAQQAAGITRLFSAFFEAGFRVAAPAFSVLLLATAGLGLVSRAVPQFNILDIGFPTRILVGLTMTGLLLPATIRTFEGVIKLTQKAGQQLVGSW